MCVRTCVWMKGDVLVQFWLVRADAARERPGNYSIAHTSTHSCELWYVHIHTLTHLIRTHTCTYIKNIIILTLCRMSSSLTNTQTVGEAQKEPNRDPYLPVPYRHIPPWALGTKTLQWLSEKKMLLVIICLLIVVLPFLLPLLFNALKKRLFWRSQGVMDGPGCWVHACIRIGNNMNFITFTSTLWSWIWYMNAGVSRSLIREVLYKLCVFFMI